MNKLLLKKQFCHFCMEDVCSRECLAEEKFVVPRLFTLKFELEQKSVCKHAAIFLTRKTYVKISNKHPQIMLRQQLFEFMVSRRKLHKVFDLI